LLREYEAVSNRLGEELSPDEMEKLLDKQSRLQEQIEAVNGWELEHQLEIAMDALRCPPPDAKVDVLSGGEKRRVALCRLLIQEPDILLLDEPTNHLDAESVQWLEQHLQQYTGTVISVTHDRYFLDNVAGWILELDRGHGMPFEGNYSSWLEQKQARLAKEEKADAKRRQTLERELEWIRMSPKGRHAKGKARLTRYEQLLGAQQDRVGGDRGRQGHRHARQARGQFAGLCRALQSLRSRSAEEGQGPLRRRAQPRAPRAHAQGRGESSAAGRADQRPGREHLAGA